MWVVAQVVVEREVGEHGIGEIAIGEALHVKVDEDVSIAGGDEEGLQRRHDGGSRALEVERVDLGIERRDLQRQVDPRYLAPRGLIEGPIGGPAGGPRRQDVEHVHIAAGVRGGLCLAEAGLTEDVERETGMATPEAPEGGEGVGGVPPGDETLGHPLHAPLGKAGDGPGGKALATGGTEQAVERTGETPAVGKVGAQVSDHIAGIAQTGVDVDEAEELGLEVLVVDGSSEDAALQRAATEERRGRPQRALLGDCREQSQADLSDAGLKVGDMVARGVDLAGNVAVVGRVDSTGRFAGGIGRVAAVSAAASVSAAPFVTGVSRGSSGLMCSCSSSPDEVRSLVFQDHTAPRRSVHPR